MKTLNFLRKSIKAASIRLLVLTGALLCGFSIAYAQAADRVFTIMVPQPAGNPTDAVARKLAPILQRELGQTVIVENLPGAGGSIGARKFLSAPPDGGGILIASQVEPILSSVAYKNAKYAPADFRPLALVARAPYILVARPGLEVNGIEDLIRLAKKSSQPLSFGNTGPGTMVHLLGEQFARSAGVQFNQIAYKGIPPALQDLMGGQIDLSFLPLGGSTVPVIQSGKVKALGSSATTPHPLLPAVRPISSQGRSLADFSYGAWIAFFVSSKVPASTVTRLNGLLNSALSDKELQAFIVSTGLEPASERTLPELDRFYTKESKQYQELAARIGVTAE